MIELRRTFKYRLYRCDKRDKHLHRQIDLAGEIWNHGVALQRRYYRLCGGYIARYRLQKHMAKLKRSARYARWQELDAQAAQDVIDRLDKAYQRFFAGKGGRPGFKKREKYRSFTLKQTSWEVLEDNKVRIRGRVYRYVNHRPLSGTIKTVTVKRDRLNRLWVCFSVIEAFEPEEEVSTGEIGGFDFGLRTFLTDHEGQPYPMPEYLKADLKRIRRLSRNLSRKKKGSHNREKARRDLAREHVRVANRRREFHFKLAHDLCDRYDVLCFEDLNLRGMKSLWGRKVSDLGFGNFIQIVEHVARKRGKTVVFIDRFAPSTQRCSYCGHCQPMPLRDRTFECGNCGRVLDRDHNAARNIEALGRQRLEEGRKTRFAALSC